MIVYVESNFVLELAFLQEEYESCLELLRLAESQDIHLVLPAFSIGEPYEVWVRRSKQRRELRDQMSTASRELWRSRPYQATSPGSESGGCLQRGNSGMWESHLSLCHRTRSGGPGG